MERLCGCGSRFKCLKTGLTVKDNAYGQNQRQRADLHGCLSCDMLLLIVNQPYPDSREEADVEITNGKAVYSGSFLKKLKEINGDISNYFADVTPRFIAIKSEADLDKLPQSFPKGLFESAKREFALKVADYDPDAHGYVSVYVPHHIGIGEPSEVFDDMVENQSWDGADYCTETDTYVISKLQNNQFMHVFIIPNEDKIDMYYPDLLAKMQLATF